MSDYPAVPGVRHAYAQAGDVRLHYAEAGDPGADPLVLLHGWPQHWYTWRRVIPRLAERYRVIAPDLRGFGWSDAPAGAYEKETLATDVIALLDTLELGRVRLAGHDWGGFTGFLVSLRAPERVSRYVALSIMHPWANLDISLSGAIRASYQFVLAAPKVGSLVQQHTPFVDQIFLRSGGDRIWTPAERASFVDSFRDPAHAAAASALYRTFITSERAAINGGRYASERLTVPTRLVVGRDDPVITAERLEGWESHADDMAVEFVEGGHFLPEEQPETVAQRALDFLA